MWGFFLLFVCFWLGFFALFLFCWFFFLVILFCFCFWREAFSFEGWIGFCWRSLLCETWEEFFYAFWMLFDMRLFYLSCSDSSEQLAMWPQDDYGGPPARTQWNLFLRKWLRRQLTAGQKVSGSPTGLHPGPQGRLAGRTHAGELSTFLVEWWKGRIIGLLLLMCVPVRLYFCMRSFGSVSFVLSC